jgi:hypothetical protein
MTDVRSRDEAEYSVQLPCAPETFAEFIAELLGKSQSIEQRIIGQFELTKNDIENTYHLVHQRVIQQNEAFLVQFTVKIFYNDGSSVLNNTLQDFLHYTEVRPLISVGVLLSWRYLIKFQDKSVPEKQEIDLSFRAEGDGSLTLLAGELIPKMFQQPFSVIFLRIDHTARTCVDMESLLANHVKGLLREEPKWKHLLHQHSGKVGILVALVFLLIVFVGVFFSTNNFVNVQMQVAQEVIQLKGTTLEDISRKLDFMVQRSASGDWPRFVFAAAIFIVISLIGSVFLGAWAGSAAENRPRSFVLLSRKAEDNKKLVLEKEKRRWFSFIASIVSSIGSGVISKLLFELVYRRWWH